MICSVVRVDKDGGEKEAYRKDTREATREATPVRIMVTPASLLPVPPLVMDSMAKGLLAGDDARRAQ